MGVWTGFCEVHFLCSDQFISGRFLFLPQNELHELESQRTSMKVIVVATPRAANCFDLYNHLIIGVL